MDLVFMTKDEIVEAFIGGLAFFVIVWYFRDYLGWSRVKSAAFIFPLTWAARKIGMNLFNHLKQKKKHLN